MCAAAGWEDRDTFLQPLNAVAEAINSFAKVVHRVIHRDLGEEPMIAFADQLCELRQFIREAQRLVGYLIN